MLRKCSTLAAISLFAVSSGQAANLLAQYEFDDAGNLGLDSSGNGNHATTVANVGTAAGVFGGAASFNGSNSDFQLAGGPFDATFNGITGRSYTAWVNIDPAKSTFGGIWSQDTGACCTTRFLLHPDNKPFINLNAHVDRHMTGVTALNTSQWYHLALVGEPDGGGSKATVYIDGNPVGTENFAEAMVNADPLNLYLGTGEGGTAWRFPGLLDDVRIYDGALTQAEVMQSMVPEPSALLLCLMAPLALLLRRKR